jgi:hypothetical protein
MQNFRDGDKVCMFGFSRGAYTARALAGMLHKVGLLPAGNHQQVPFAYKMYTDHNDRGWKQSIAFKRAFCRDIEIEFLGVWDTVQSVGVIPKHRLPFTASSNHVRYFRHAISLDERRARFQPNFWLPGYPMNKNEPQVKGKKKSKKQEPKQEQDDEDTKIFTESPVSTPPASPSAVVHNAKVAQGEHNGKHKLRRDESEFNEMERSIIKQSGEAYVEDAKTYETDILEVWFAGCHCDVGGGSVLNNTPNALSRITLRWMIRQCFLANTGIMFDKTMMHEIGMNADALYPRVLPRPPMIHSNEPIRPQVITLEESHGVKIAALDKPTDEEEEDVKDALSPIYDQLTLAPSWWVLEIIPTKLKVQMEHGIKRAIRSNLGRGRWFPHEHAKRGIRVHRTVKIRMEAAKNGHLMTPSGKKIKYNPKAKWNIDPIWVD